MEPQFYALDDAEEIAGSELTFPRARALYDAVQQHRDFSLVGAFRGKVIPEAVPGEILIVDVSCDGVPPSNPADICFTERLALCVPEDPSILVEVLALRVGFPLLMHQNSVLPGRPPNLCLYQEPPRSVARTWTAPSVLKRIQVWLEGSARGTLHAVDQAVEQLFFVSPFELILPWNFESLHANRKAQFWVARGPERPGKGGTFFLDGSTDGKTERTASLVSLTLPAVVHGRVESDAGTLGQLADALSERGIDLLGALASEVENRVGTGIDVGKDDPGTVLLMRIPIARAEGEPPSKIAHRAYFLNIGILELGSAMGAIYAHNGNYYREAKANFITPQAKTVWRDQDVMPMEVLQCIDRCTARSQSGLATEGPVGVLVGAVFV